MYVIDTDVAIEYLRGNPEVVEKLKRLDELYITTVTIAELYYGAYSSKNPSSHFEGLANFFEKVDFLTLDIGSSRVFGKLKSRLKKNGKMMGNFDMLIASIALLFDFFLITRNTKDFQRIDRLKLLRI